jgi:hypothetical protein
MRPMFALAVVLLLSASLAGCSNPRRAALAAVEAEAPLELPEVDSTRGTAFVTVGGPTWKPGYHFRFEEEGAEERHFVGDGFDGQQAHSEATSWGPRPGLNYTVVGNDTNAFGEVRFLALHREGYSGERPRLVALEAEHLEARDAYVSDYCTHFRSDCAPYVSVYGDKDEVPPLAFPLRDDVAGKEEAGSSWRPYVPLEPIAVVTRVLGFKDVDGPFGPVQAVHVQQRFTVNFTDVLAQWRQDQPDLTGFALDGEVHATRDVYYAPALLNVVLDQAVSHGHYNGSYQRDGKAQGFRESWRSWSSSRLVDASLEEGEALSLQEVSALLRAQASPSPEAGVVVSLDGPKEELNVAAAAAATLTATLAGTTSATVRIDVLNALGVVVASDEASSLAFTPTLPGPYLAVAYALGSTGRALAADSWPVRAYYEGTLAVECEPLAFDGATACPAMPVPMGPAIGYLRGEALINDPLATASLRGRLVVDQGDGQEVSTDQNGGSASLWLDSPQWDLGQDWLLRYEPDVGVTVSVEYGLVLWPAHLPSYVYEAAYADL